MRYGVGIIPADYAIDPVSLGRAAEDLGFESIFLPEHSHIPVSRRTPFPSGPVLPDAYRRVIDVFVALGAIAAATKNLKLGTSVCLVIERDPIVTAKQVASLDHLSGGRLIFGVGGGWNREEMEDHGTDPRLRWKILRERCLAMKEIWTRDEAEFHGEFVDFGPIWSWPKPVLTPPVLIGGEGPTVL
ncbi:MAG TPA: TIGR03619 family F420-dependent LLM class oxidoreductase, partial [Dehalococcoidia bacterium]|nr:TIGR03619 family F420-dependent LLM class oxidoreductase [Dehalococcoidia bacterium]